MKSREDEGKEEEEEEEEESEIDPLTITPDCS